jgi:hypothetical protein
LTDFFAVTFFEIRRDFVRPLRLTTLFAAFIFLDLILRAVARFLRLAIAIPHPYIQKPMEILHPFSDQ